MSFTGFNGVRGVSVSAGDNHGLTVPCTQGLQSFHELGLHFIFTRVFAIELRFAETWVICPIHFDPIIDFQTLMAAGHPAQFPTSNTIAAITSHRVIIPFTTPHSQKPVFSAT